MSAVRDDLVAAALVSPTAAAGWSGGQWSRLIHQGRRAGLLARLAEHFADHRLVPPPGAAGHLEAARRVWRAQQAEIQRETGFIAQALAGLGAPVVLLKGAAYVMAGLPAASGRVFGDIDIMVPRAVIARAESSLGIHGWMSTHHSAYDQRYYREWMHELPPLQHLQRGTVLDVHHAIVPLTARSPSDPASLFVRAHPLPGLPGIHVLAPEDMVLHSMTHLFANDDVTYSLRDLSDLDLLLRAFDARPGFWPTLVHRADELNFGRALHYGLRHTARVLGTPVPAEVALEVGRRHAPPPGTAVLMEAVWQRTLRAPHPSAELALSGLARTALFLRGHWLRMPAGLLVRHLTVKSLRLHVERTKDTPAPPP